jgi:hypothetical protein
MAFLEGEALKDFQAVDKLIKVIQKNHPTHSEPNWNGSYEGKEDVKGMIECTSCGSPLAYTILGTNDHIEAHCINKDCFINFKM